MSLFLDLFIVIIIAIAVISGFVRGFIKSVMGFASTVLSFFTAVYFTPLLSDFLCERVFLSKISAGLRDTLSSLLGIGIAEKSTEELFAADPPMLSSMLERYNVDIPSFKSSFSSPLTATADTVSEMSDAIARPVAESISSAVAFLVIFIAALIILKIVTFILDAMFELPVLKQLNSALGLVFGIMCAFVYALVLSHVMATLTSSLRSMDSSLFSPDIIEKTAVVKLFAGIKISLLVKVLGEAVSGV